MENRSFVPAATLAENLSGPESSRSLPRTAMSGWDELDLVCHALSHDLRAPLRAIDGSAKLLRASLGERLNAEDAARLQILIQAGQLEAQLLDALLLLCRVARMDLKVREVDVSNLTKKILGELSKSEPSRKTQLTIAPDLKVRGDPQLLEIALRHLLENAWKFTQKEERASIELGAGKLEGRKALYVRDNGVGFDVSQTRKLFGVFERLDTAADFVGIGIGLAIVKKIVDRHGGSILAWGEIGKGAAFWFTFSGAPA